MRLFTIIWPFLVVLTLLISPAIVISLRASETLDVPRILLSLSVALLVFTAPAGLCFRNVKLYFYLLTPLVVLTPVFLFSIYYFGLPPGFELIAFTLQTNPREAQEAIAPFLAYFIVFQLVFVIAYTFSVRMMRKDVLQPRWTLGVSILSFSLLAAIIIYSNELFSKSLRQITKHDLILKYEYPFTLLSGVAEAHSFLTKNNLHQAQNFSFKAVKSDTLTSRQVYVLIIGESSRYDRWQVNGYTRETSPRLNSVKDLITYSDVVSGAHYTWVSVPQIITRANPDNYDLQYKEKSILAVFQEAGFRTYWLSNQSDQDIFWSGSITLHARTADVYSFSPTWSPNLEFENIYDGRLLPMLDSVLRADREDLFIVLHTMGNHWEYNRRYPPEFDVFRPSEYPDPGNPAHLVNREAIWNSYDNSIRYADFFIHSVIETVNRNADISTVTFISDHGEDLFDAYGDRADFHFRPSAATLRVPLFVWTSDSYKNIFPAKRANLEAHASMKIGTENLFYTLTDIANIRIEDFDPSRSFAHPDFIPSEQKYYGDDRKGHFFSTLP